MASALTRANAERWLAKYGSVEAAAKVMKVGKGKIEAALGQKGEDVKTTPRQSTKPAGKSLADFRNVYDKDTIIPAKIKTGLKTLGNGWEYEVQFAKMCGVSLMDMGTYREAFTDYWHQIKSDGRKVWSGSKTTMDEIRKVVC